MIALIDADIVTHRIGFTTENETLGIAKWRCDDLLDRILLDTNATEYKLFLSDSKENNFRYKIDPSYKANRVAPKPRHYEMLKEHMVVHWGAKFSYGMEADDCLGIDQDKSGKETVICSIDKDLMQIPGLHYNFVKKVWTTVSIEEGLLSFYRSILTGDVADNIKGVYGIGPAKARKILPKWEGEESCIKAIIKAYIIYLYKEKYKVEPDFPDFYTDQKNQAKEIIIKNGRLLKILQTEDEKLWDSEWLNVTEAEKLSSIPSKEEGSSRFMEPTIQVQKNLDGSSVLGQNKEDIKPMDPKAD